MRNNPWLTTNTARALHALGSWQLHTALCLSIGLTSPVPATEQAGVGAASAVPAAAHARDQADTERQAHDELIDKLSKCERELTQAQSESERLDLQLGEQLDRIAELQAKRDTLAPALAAVRAELADARNTLSAAEAKRNALNARIETATTELEQRATALQKVGRERDESREQLAAAQADLAAARQAMAAADGELEQVSQALKAAREDIAAKKAATSDLRADLAMERAEISRLGNDLHRAALQQARLQAMLGRERERKDDLRSDIESLMAGLPPRLGGSLSLPRLEQQAAEVAERLNAIHIKLQRQPGDEATSAELETMVQHLHELQMLILSETRATGLYRLRPRDTLATVARRFLGDGAQWRAVYEANDHVIGDPDQLVAGLTLIVP